MMGSIIGVAASGSTIAVASTADNLGSPAIAALVFTRDAISGTWSLFTTLATPSASDGSIALRGGLLALGSSSGTVYVYTRSGAGTWSQAAVLSGAVTVDSRPVVAVSADESTLAALDVSLAKTSVFRVNQGSGWGQTARLSGGSSSVALLSAGVAVTSRRSQNLLRGTLYEFNSTSFS
jgi:hypothetical protein